MKKLIYIVFLFVFVFSVSAVEISRDQVTNLRLNDTLLELSTGRNPQTGKEIQIAALFSDDNMEEISSESRVFITTNDGIIYSSNAKINHKMYDLSSYLSEIRCGISKNNEIVCEVRPYDGGQSLYCLGNNELRECPEEEIVSFSGSGNVSVEEFSMKKSSSNEGEIEVLSWSWGVSSRSSEVSDVDGDNLELSYVWFVRGDDKPTESLSLSFGKIEITYSNQDGFKSIVEVDSPEFRVSKDNLVFTTISFNKISVDENLEICRVSTILGGEGCNDEDADRRPDVIDADGNGHPDLLELVFSELNNLMKSSSVEGLSKADAKKALDGFTRIVNNIQSTLDRCEDDVCRQVELNADKRHGLLERAKEDNTDVNLIVNEIRNIIEEDLESLERCESDVCHLVLAKEKELFNLVDYYIELIVKSGDTIWPSEWETDLNLSRSINDNIPDYLDIDDDGDGILTRDEPSTINRDVVLSRAFITDTTGSMGNRIVSRPNEWTNEDRETIGEYVRNLENLEGSDFGLAIAYHVSGNERVREIRYNNQTNVVEIDHDEEIRLLGFIRMNARARTIIDEQGNEETMFPWWSFLATKDKGSKFKAGADISKSVN